MKIDQKRVIFLDIDGVLVNYESMTGRARTPTGATTASGQLLTRASFDPNCVRCLNQITHETGAVIVVSSSWRDDWPGVCEILKEEGVEAKVIGRTPDLPGTERGVEIQAWLADAVGIESFVIIDDDNDMGEFKERLIQTFFEHGLQPQHVGLAIEKLREAA